MVLGLYYMTKGKKSTETEKVKGDGIIFYSPEEVTIAYNEGKVDLHAIIKVKVNDKVDGQTVNHIVETTVGRVIFNRSVPEEVGFINEILTKKSLRDIIGRVLKMAGTAKTADFLDAIKNQGFYSAFKGGLSFNLDDVIIPEERRNSLLKVMSRLKRFSPTTVWDSLPIMNDIIRSSISGHTLMPV